jgi:hypothetical protein
MKRNKKIEFQFSVFLFLSIIYHFVHIVRGEFVCLLDARHAIIAASRKKCHNPLS